MTLINPKVISYYFEVTTYEGQWHLASPPPVHPSGKVVQQKGKGLYHRKRLKLAQEVQVLIKQLL